MTIINNHNRDHEIHVCSMYEYHGVHTYINLQYIYRHTYIHSTLKVQSTFMYMYSSFTGRPLHTYYIHVVRVVHECMYKCIILYKIYLYLLIYM